MKKRPGKGLEEIVLLVVLDAASPELARILSCLEALDIALTVVSGCRGARRELRKTKPSVVITGVTLCDGNWCGVLRSVVESAVAASVVVYSRKTDERLRSEAIARGAYGLLSGAVSVPDMRECVETAHLFR